MIAEDHSLLVYCDSSAHLRQDEVTPRRSLVASLVVRSYVEGECHVMPVPVIVASTDPLRAVRHLLTEGDEKWLRETSPGELKRPPEQVAPGHLDRRWKFRCTLCGWDVQMRDSRLTPIAEKLRSAGVAEISLAALASRLQ